MTPLASLSPSQSRPAGFGNLASPRGQVDPQATLANRLANRLGLEPGALDGKREDFTPDKVADRVQWKPDARIQGIVDSWPVRFNTARATKLGFSADADVETIIRSYIAEQGIKL